jgi:hypothetical protein
MIAQYLVQNPGLVAPIPTVETSYENSLIAPKTYAIFETVL